MKAADTKAEAAAAAVEPMVEAAAAEKLASSMN